MAPSPIDKDMAELVIPSLPLETRCPPFPRRQYGGFWMPEPFLPGMAAARAGFQPRPSDVVLASFPKSGTTWLKALAFTITNRFDHAATNDTHPLLTRHPQDLVPFLEMPYRQLPPLSDLEKLPYPRLLYPHFPVTLLPPCVVTLGCRVVYLCRSPKDVLVSLWHFI